LERGGQEWADTDGNCCSQRTGHPSPQGICCGWSGAPQSSFRGKGVGGLTAEQREQAGGGGIRVDGCVALWGRGVRHKEAHGGGVRPEGGAAPGGGRGDRRGQRRPEGMLQRGPGWRQTRGMGAPGHAGAHPAANAKDLAGLARKALERRQGVRGREGTYVPRHWFGTNEGSPTRMGRVFRTVGARVRWLFGSVGQGHGSWVA